MSIEKISKGYFLHIFATVMLSYDTKHIAVVIALIIYEH